MGNPGLILVVGATGYVGSRLVPLLLEKGYRVRAAARSIQKLKNLAWANHPHLELVTCNVLDARSLSEAVRGAQAAYYLVHSMEPGQKNFAKADRDAALGMVKAAADAGLERIVYLAGLGDESVDLSHHLKSRREVEHVLKSGPVPVTIFRAAMIIGSGSASFEILRYLVEHLPFMITPRWVSTESQPIAIRNVLFYLVRCLEIDATLGETYEIGGPEVLTYRRLMEIYAEEAGLPKRWVIPVPVLTPRLSSYWIHLVTPIHAAIARPLAEGLKNRVVVSDSSVFKTLPQKLLSVREAIKASLELPHIEDPDKLRTFTSNPEWPHAADPAWAGGTVFRENRSVILQASVKQVWDCVASIGGKNGWYFADWLWQLRGWIDVVFGGDGMRRGRPNYPDPKAGDRIDFWRVVEANPGRRLLLYAEMKMPGTAWLDFVVNPIPEGKTVLDLKVRFVPKGLGGLAYWYAVWPFHQWIFNGLLRAIQKKIEVKNR